MKEKIVVCGAAWFSEGRGLADMVEDIAGWLRGRE